MEAKGLVEATINENRDRLNNISREIWSNPEKSFEERHAHDILTQFLAEDGFQIERNYIFPTGFRATFGSSEGDKFIFGDKVILWETPIMLSIS